VRVGSQRSTKRSLKVLGKWFAPLDGPSKSRGSGGSTRWSLQVPGCDDGRSKTRTMFLLLILPLEMAATLIVLADLFTLGVVFVSEGRKEWHSTGSGGIHSLGGSFGGRVVRNPRNKLDCQLMRRSGLVSRPGPSGEIETCAQTRSLQHTQVSSVRLLCDRPLTRGIMGNCCGKSTPNPIVYHHGYKTHDGLEVPTHVNGGDPRYTADPNRPLRAQRQGPDIIRTPATPSPLSPQRGHIVVAVYNFQATPLSPQRGHIVVAVYNFQAREATDVSFSKGDRMEVLDDSETDWWKVRHLHTGAEGLIPWNFVAEEKSVESEE
ncbi:unnamed protein product, partial [Timema podura]|nr:unnamed protein product [Timema podura]